MNILQLVGFQKAPPPAPVVIDRKPPPAPIRPAQGRATYDFSFSTVNLLAQIQQQQNLGLFAQLRKLIPIMDRGIRLRVALMGCPTIEASNPETKADIEQWMANLHVNHLQAGFSLFLQTWLDHMFLYGRSHAEILYTGRGDDIWGIQQLSTPTIFFRPREDHVSVDIVQQTPGRGMWTTLDPRNMLTALHSVEGDDPYGNSLYAACPFVAEIYVSMVRSLGEIWKRHGVPDWFVDVTLGEGIQDPEAIFSTSLRSEIAAAFNEALSAKANGLSLPFVSVQGGGGKTTVGIIGAEGEALEFSTPAGDMLDQIVSATGAPAWMLGLKRGTTERLSTNEASILTETVENDQAAVTPELHYLISRRQALRGGSQEFKIKWDGVSLLDKKEQADADLSAAQAKKAEVENLTSLWRDGFLDAYDVARLVVPGFKDLTREEMDRERATNDLPPLSTLEPPAAPAPTSPFGGAGGNQEHPAPPALGRRSITYDDGFVKNGNGRH